MSVDSTDVPRIIEAVGLYKAVVDIGPTTNNGPGDQTKGILDWSASPIRIVNTPGAGKFIQVLGWSFQFKPGVTPYVDSFPSQSCGLFAGAGLVLRTSLSNTGLNNTSTQLYSWPTTIAFFTDNSDPTVGLDNTALFFGGANGSPELTLGDGQVRITVHYAIDDILT